MGKSHSTITHSYFPPHWLNDGSNYYLLIIYIYFYYVLIYTIEYYYKTVLNIV